MEINLEKWQGKKTGIEAVRHPRNYRLTFRFLSFGLSIFVSPTSFIYAGIYFANLGTMAVYLSVVISFLLK